MLALTVFAAACIDHRCPKGYDQKGDTCYRKRDAGPEGGVAEGGVAENETDTEGATDETERRNDADDDAGADGGRGSNVESCLAAAPGARCDGGIADSADAATDVCDPNACKNGGKCSRTGRSPSCDCAGTGFDGLTCERDIDECAAPNVCTSPEYPCVETEPPGYTCQGQFADWPMPDAVRGAKIKPSYDTLTNPDLVVDKVTGLVWQRELPEKYAGCRATFPGGGLNHPGQVCTW